MADRVVPESGRKRRRATKAGVVLSEAMIVDTALRMVEEHGPEGMSARRLGRALGADPSAVYRYFRNMDTLLLAMADELITRVTREWHPTGDWRSDLYRWGLSAHAEYLKYPQAARITAARITGRPAELTGVELILAALRDAGFSDRLAVLGYRIFVTQMLSYATRDGAAKLVHNRGEDVDRWKSIYARASAETYPNISAVAGLLEQHDGGSTYPLALRMLLITLQNMLMPSQTPLVPSST